ncbi:hypothetical protein RNAN_1694 [Rheinheimera nanhaiensis E407-8]|uniref:Uncharacterized protein n=1 Tax=Rheinheimera nanhaiensis E407-8 TaxID=562729 RepID=I1DXC9_9GAMM|nr:hypothetical protein RNAN_1694 [Rheinheimera nanhaiensis E407-8]
MYRSFSAFRRQNTPAVPLNGCRWRKTGLQQQHNNRETR